MKQMREQGFKFDDNISFFYSSPVDSESVLERYLAKKDYPGIAFGANSQMIETFGAWSFPTFFEISPSGEILSVHYGSGDTVRDLLF